MNDVPSRRTFLRLTATAGATWAVADFTQIEDALTWAAERRRAGARDVAALTREQAADVEAMAMRIMPNDDGTPGAGEAGVIQFIDRSLDTFAADDKPQYDEGLNDLNARVGRKHRGVTHFSALSPAQQDELLREIEQTPFFNMVRGATLVGMFALPSYGGNRDYIGWSLIGHEHKPLFQPPFGYYDAAANGGR